MKAFQIVPKIREYERFAEFAGEAGLQAGDLILTNEWIYKPKIEELHLDCRILFVEKYGMGEPTDVMADAVLEELKDSAYDRIVAVGGGTIIDLAKVLAVAEADDRVADLYGRMDALQKVHPLLIVPTTCGTGSEVTNIAIINRTDKGIKQGLASSAMFADEAVLIPELLEGLPYKVYAASSIDAMVHAVESYLSPQACSLSELFSEQAVSLLIHSWKAAVASAQPDGWKQYGAALLRASNYAGIAFGHAGCAAVHALSYPLGGVHHVPHGEANHVMFEPVMRAYMEKKPDGRLYQLRTMLGSLLDCAPEAALENLFALLGQVQERKPMQFYGVTAQELAQYTENVMETQQRLLKNNYVPLTRDDILQIYRNAF
ncbi:MAG: 4-hydroxybutyrate dehydrogenase [Lachnospiraceae bacterium]|nr:4-hydroxybutyrate dehydrogenase [Lachnospiraceae bacterium]